MKLRIKGNSLRLRLSQSEVARLAIGDVVTEVVQFSLVDKLTYCAEVWHLDIIEASFEKEKLTVRLPEKEVNKWATTEQVSMEYLQPNDSEGLKILVEKDFACLAEREGEDESDNFPHPKTGEIKC